MSDSSLYLAHRTLLLLFTQRICSESNPGLQSSGGTLGNWPTAHGRPPCRGELARVLWASFQPKLIASSGPLFGTHSNFLAEATCNNPGKRTNGLSAPGVICR